MASNISLCSKVWKLLIYSQKGRATMMKCRLRVLGTRNRALSHFCLQIFFQIKNSKLELDHLHLKLFDHVQDYVVLDCFEFVS